MCIKNEDKTQKYNDSRRKRYRMLDTASSILKKERVATCSRHVSKFGIAAINGGITLSINNFNRAQYSGVNVCGSVWHCPVCAERIGSFRADEVSIGIAEHVKHEGWALFLTLTHSHHKHENLKTLLKAESKASQEMRNSTAFKNALKKHGYLGSVKALETLYGFNGWHNHTHEVMFVSGRLTQLEVRKLKLVIFNQWSYYCEKNGLGLPNFNGVDLQVPYTLDSIGRYVSKWGYELTHCQMKSGKNGNRTPFNILSDLEEKYTFRDVKLFREYADAFKGSRQLRWSKGLKKRFGIKEIKDSKIKHLPIKKVITIIKKHDWYMILGANKRVELLELVEYTLAQGGNASQAVHDFIAKLSEVLSLVKYRKLVLKRHTSDLCYLNTELHILHDSMFFDDYNPLFYQSHFHAIETSHENELSRLVHQETLVENLYGIKNMASMTPKHIKF